MSEIPATEIIQYVLESNLGCDCAGFLFPKKTPVVCSIEQDSRQITIWANKHYLLQLLELSS